MKKQSVIQNNKWPEVQSLKLVLLSAGFAVLALAIGALCLGRYYVSPVQVARILCSLVFPMEQTWTQPMHDVVINLRLPRVLAAILVGGALSLAGATYQGMFQNPLVSPDILGVSSGACVGAATGILLGVGTAQLQILAFIGGIVAVILTTTLPRLMRRKSNIIMVLSGVIVGGFMASSSTVQNCILSMSMRCLARLAYRRVYNLNCVDFTIYHHMNIPPPCTLSILYK